METIQVVLDAKLLKAADVAAKRQRMNRSALIRLALEQHLKRLRELELEEQDRRGYLAHPQREEEFRLWEDAAAWPPHFSTPAAAPASPPIPAAAS
jgi:metal-responsive CopG/Arc/MetJ family transcriptional regulator